MKTKTTATYTPERPYIGQPCTVRGIECKIFAIHPMGTIDIVSLDGKRAYRVSGLAFI